MPSSSDLRPMPYEQRVNRIARLERVANRLDSQFRLPIIGIRFGWDSILGLVPGVGDLATSLPSAFVIYEAINLGARRRTIARISMNTVIDLVVGSIPILGDVFDMTFKSHKRNVFLLKTEILAS